MAENNNKVDSKYIEALTSRCQQMSEYLSRHVSNRHLKSRLHDQLIWLQYQIKYYQRKGDLELLEENYNWVVSNFNHDLHLPQGKQFTSLNLFSSMQNKQ